MVVLRDSNKNPDVVMLVYCTTENKELLHECIEVLKDTEEFYKMGLTESTYIVPAITKPMPAHAVVEPLGHCSHMDKIERIIKDIMSK